MNKYMVLIGCDTIMDQDEIEKNLEKLVNQGIFERSIRKFIMMQREYALVKGQEDFFRDSENHRILYELLERSCVLYDLKISDPKMFHEKLRKSWFDVLVIKHNLKVRIYEQPEDLLFKSA